MVGRVEICSNGTWGVICNDFFDDIDLRVYLRDVEIVLIESALKKSEGTVSKASELLKINRTTLIEKMKKLMISS